MLLFNYNPIMVLGEYRKQFYRSVNYYYVIDKPEKFTKVTFEVNGKTIDEIPFEKAIHVFKGDNLKTTLKANLYLSAEKCEQGLGLVNYCIDNLNDDAGTLILADWFEDEGFENDAIKLRCSGPTKFKYFKLVNLQGWFSSKEKICV